MRAIDADELKKCFSLTLHGKEVYNAEEILMTIQTAPTIEAEPVVHCKDCKYRLEKGCHGYLAPWIGAFEDGDYCSMGERKDETD